MLYATLCYNVDFTRVVAIYKFNLCDDAVEFQKRNVLCCYPLNVGRLNLIMLLDKCLLGK